MRRSLLHCGAAKPKLPLAGLAAQARADDLKPEDAAFHRRYGPSTGLGKPCRVFLVFSGVESGQHELASTLASCFFHADMSESQQECVRKPVQQVAGHQNYHCFISIDADPKIEMLSNTCSVRRKSSCCRVHVFPWRDIGLQAASQRAREVMIRLELGQCESVQCC